MVDLIYLACPYSGTKDEIDHRVALLMHFDAQLMQRNIFTVSPVYKHLMRLHNEKIPGDWAYWGSYSEAVLTKCAMMIVLCMPGWKESPGVKGEIKIARERNIPVMYLTSFDVTDDVADVIHGILDF